jgi:hypothetical protein
MFCIVAIILSTAGCMEAVPAPPPARPAAPERATAFDPATTGRITGRVRWDGDVPDVPEFTAYVNGDYALANTKVVRQPNPLAPRVEPASHGVQDVVVYLRGVDPAKARPWDLPAVRIEHDRQRLRLRQGGHTSRVGFVACGADVEAVSNDAEYHALRARGATFFTLPLPDAGVPSRRRLGTPGVVELSSGAGHFWMRAYLLVADHPYYARTDEQGRFTLEKVPAGAYEVVCWTPSWVVTRRERNPESGQVGRIEFAPPVEQTAPVRVGPGQTREVDFTWSAAKIAR